MQIVLVAIDIRSTYNVGSILRTADGFGVKTLYCCGYTPYISINDSRPPHIRTSNKKSISKTALGAEKSVKMVYVEDPRLAIKQLRSNKYEIIGLEQTLNSVNIRSFESKGKKIALLLGNEPDGLSNEVIEMLDYSIEIPMQGKKESFNVSVACGIALYALT